MNKNRVLPIAMVVDVVNLTPYTSGYAVGMATQRDADWVVLQRDYVPREKVKPLMKAAATLTHYFEPLEVGAAVFGSLPELTERVEGVWEALAQLGKP